MHQASAALPRLLEQPVAVVVVATISPQPEHRDAVREAVLSAIPQVHGEPGCERYALHEGQDGRLVMIEQWESPEALATHGKGEALTALSRALEGKLTGRPELQVLTAVPAGDDGKGAL
jgi:quinol monooxygenase YgiN